MNDGDYHDDDGCDITILNHDYDKGCLSKSSCFSMAAIDRFIVPLLSSNLDWLF